jgi:hypothetical protein
MENSMLLIATTVGPAEIGAGRAYMHDLELDGDWELAIGMRVEVADASGRVFDAVVTRRVGARWQLAVSRSHGLRRRQGVSSGKEWCS